MARRAKVETVTTMKIRCHKCGGSCFSAVLGVHDAGTSAFVKMTCTPCGAFMLVSTGVPNPASAWGKEIAAIRASRGGPRDAR